MRKIPAILILAMACASAQADATTQPAGGKGACHALLIGSLPGTAIHARQYRDWLKRFHAYLTGPAGVPAGNVVVLTGDKDFRAPIVTGPATAESIAKAFGDLAKKVQPQDQFVLVLLGLGSAEGNSSFVVLPGPDLSAEQLALLLEPLTARNQVVLNFTSCGGLATPALSRAGRVVVSGNMPQETVPPVYPEFFLRGLESARADGAGSPEAGAKDGTITLLEAYNWAAYQSALWIARQNLADDGSWRVTGKESVEIFRKLYVSDTNEPGSRKLSPDSDANAPDAVVPLKMKGQEDIEIAKSKRRVITEHAALEDNGAKEPVSALGDESKDYAPLSGKGKGSPGSLARGVVLGRAELLPAEPQEAKERP